MRRHTLAVLAAAAALGLPVQFAAAQTPSADDIIAGLRPNAQQLTGPTRGIRRLPSSPATPHQSATRAEPEPDASPAADNSSTEAPSVKLVVDFQTGSAELTPSASRTLDQLGRALSSAALSAFHFRVEGHTDTVGSPDANKDLSERRAQAVASYLETKFGIAEARLQPVGMGSSQLLVQTPDQTPEPRNRRVRIVNLGA